MKAVLTVLVVLPLVLACSKPPVLEADKQNLITLKDLAAAGILPGASTKESYDKTDYVGTIHLEYKLRHEGSLLLSSRTFLDLSVEDGASTYALYPATLSASMKATGKAERKDDLFKFGDESAVVEASENGQPIGHALCARKGRITFVLIFAKPLLSNADFRSHLAARLDAIAAPLNANTPKLE